MAPFRSFLLLASRTILAAVLPCLLTCSNSNPDTQTGQGTIGAYCDQILPAFCTYAVSTCGLSGTVSQCVSDARSPCCQGTCGRAAQLVEPDVIARCTSAYTGQSTGGASGNGGSAGSASGAGGNLSCTDIRAGLAPAACREIFQLLADPILVPGRQ